MPKKETIALNWKYLIIKNVIKYSWLYYLFIFQIQLTLEVSSLGVRNFSNSGFS